MQTKLLINGELVAGQGQARTVLDPATGEAIVSIPEASQEQVSAAITPNGCHVSPVPQTVRLR